MVIVLLKASAKRLIVSKISLWPQSRAIRRHSFHTTEGRGGRQSFFWIFPAYSFLTLLFRWYSNVSSIICLLGLLKQNEQPFSPTGFAKRRNNQPKSLSLPYKLTFQCCWKNQSLWENIDQARYINCSISFRRIIPKERNGCIARLK